MAMISSSHRDSKVILSSFRFLSSPFQNIDGLTLYWPFSFLTVRICKQSCLRKQQSCLRVRKSCSTKQLKRLYKFDYQLLIKFLYLILLGKI